MHFQLVLYKKTTLNHQICVVWGRELFTFPFETKRLLHILCWRWGMAPLEAVIKYTLWRNSEENKNCFFSNVVEPLQKVMIKTEVVICKFHAKSNFHVTRSVFQRLKCSSSSQSLVFSFPRFSCDCFFPVYHSDRSFLSFLVVNVVVNMLPVHFYWIRWSNI